MTSSRPAASEATPRPADPNPPQLSSRQGLGSLKLHGAAAATLSEARLGLGVGCPRRGWG